MDVGQWVEHGCGSVSGARMWVSEWSTDVGQWVEHGCGSVGGARMWVSECSTDVGQNAYNLS